jgi:hypothetical protein
MTYTQIFGGTTIYPSDVSLLALALDADKALDWPLESNDPSNPAARIIDVTTSGAYSITLPDATQTGAGQTILFNNLPASTNSFTLKDAGGNTIATVDIGEQWQVYLSDTSTVAGTWRVFRYGASTATVQPSALAGYGITVTSNALSQSTPVTTFNSSPQTVLDTDRASALVWVGTGSGTLNLPSTAVVGNDFFISVRNNGGGDLTVDAAGSETIDDVATLALRPGESTSLITDGLKWFTLGLGQEAVFAFDYTSITVTGGNYTLSGSELNRIAYKFVGTLTADQYVIVPPTVQQYWIDNATTGSFTFHVQTAGGTPVVVSQGARGIFYCNGVNIIDADTSTVSLPISAANGGTGITSYSIGDILYASAATTLSKLADVATGNALISGGVGVAPNWGKIGLATHVSGTLTVPNGGTGATTLTGYVKGNGTGAFTANTAVPVADISGTLNVAKGGTGAGTLTGYLVGNGTSAFTAAASIPASDISSGAALTRTNDTNVTLTLAGSPSTSLLAATSLTLGWTGTLAVSRGGTGAGTFTTNKLLKGSGTSAIASSSITDNGSIITVDSGVGFSVARTGVTSPVANDGNVFSGTYTPSQVSTNINVDALTFSECQYLRVGNAVTVSGQLGINATSATTDTVARISLPVASTFSASRQLGGTGVQITSPYGANSCVMLADASNNCVEIRLSPSSALGLTYNFSFTYQVR